MWRHKLNNEFDSSETNVGIYKMNPAPTFKSQNIFGLVVEVENMMRHFCVLSKYCAVAVTHAILNMYTYVEYYMLSMRILNTAIRHGQLKA